MEAAELGIFMVSAAIFTTSVEHPASPIRQAIDDPLVRRAIVGIAMGLTAIGIIYSPWGKQSGAHFNPSVTLTFFRLGKIKAWDASFYIFAQFGGGVIGMLLARAIIGEPIAHAAIRYAVTVPGVNGITAAFLAEMVISFILMSVILTFSNSKQLAQLTGLCAGALVAVYVIFEGPFSGMSMNPARTLASALPAHVFTAIWIYFTAPPFGMLLAGEVYRRKTSRGNACAKLHHKNNKRCIFCGVRGGTQAEVDSISRLT